MSCKTIKTISKVRQATSFLDSGCSTVPTRAGGSEGDAAEARRWGCRTESKRGQHVQEQQAISSPQLDTRRKPLLSRAETWRLRSPLRGGENHCGSSSQAEATGRWSKHRFKENKAENIQIYWKNAFSWEATRRKSV